jgi:hypothetical protein
MILGRARRDRSQMMESSECMLHDPTVLAVTRVATQRYGLRFWPT